MYSDDDYDYYSPWEWQPVENMPHGCNDLTIEYADGSRADICSCDYWWAYSDPKNELPIKFRYE